MKTHEFSQTTTRRSALGLVGAFAAIAVGAAGPLHRRAVLDLEMDVLEARYASGEDGGGVAVDTLDVRVVNGDDVEIEPVFYSWHQARNSRYNWLVESGPDTLSPGETATYRVRAKTGDGFIKVGLPAQLTLFDSGRQRWKSIQFVVEGPDG